MELQETNEGWHLQLNNGRIQLIQIDFRLGLFIYDDRDQATIFVETRFLLRERESELMIDPEQTSSLAPILSYFNASVSDVSLTKTGKLNIKFTSGNTLEVNPDNSYEAWQLACLGRLLVCSPGGKVAFYMEPRKSS